MDNRTSKLPDRRITQYTNFLHRERERKVSRRQKQRDRASILSESGDTDSVAPSDSSRKSLFKRRRRWWCCGGRTSEYPSIESNPTEENTSDGVGSSTPERIKRWGELSRYTGEYKDGLRHGQGREDWSNGIEYVGTWRRGLKEGLGMWLDPRSKQRYEGQWKDNVKEGWGIFETKDIRYEGYWSQDMINGKGECVYIIDGDRTQTYVGNWHMGFRTGMGTFNFSNGCTYDGMWDSDCPTGRGVFTWPMGIKLEAGWLLGKPQVGGVFVSPTGQLVSGVDYGAIVSRHLDFRESGQLCTWSDDVLALYHEFTRYQTESTSTDQSLDQKDNMDIKSSNVLVGTVPETWTEVVQLGRGAFGAVFKCLNNSDGSIFALKRVDIRCGGPVRREVRALDLELSVLRKLRHPNIVGYLGAREDDKGSLCVMMEFVAGGDVEHLLRQMHNGLPLPVLRRYTQDVLRGIAYLHDNKIAHRDIKGGNVLIGASGSCRVADFGVAARFDAISGSGVRGTPYFIAPEVIRGDPPTPESLKKSDIWSVGCTVFQMATGQPPWMATLGTAPFYYVVGKIVSGDDLPLNVPNTIDAEVEQIIRTLMSSDPNARPSAASLIGHQFFHVSVDRCCATPPLLSTGSPSMTSGISPESVAASSTMEFGRISVV